MEGDGAVGAMLHFQPAAGDQLVDELGVMDDFIIAAKSRVFVLQGVQAVGAGGHDAFGGYFIEDFHVGESQLEEQIFFAGPPGGIAGALLLFS